MLFNGGEHIIYRDRDRLLGCYILHITTLLDRYKGYSRYAGLGSLVDLKENEVKMLKKTFEFYKNHLLGNIVILLLSIAGGLLAIHFDFFRLARFLDETLVSGIYTALCVVLYFPILLLFNAISLWLKKKPFRFKRRANYDNLRLADGMILESMWTEHREHPLTLINETGHEIKNCYVMLDEVAGKNFNKKWEVVTKEIYDRPFKWNRDSVVAGKIDIDHGERASFVIISHHEYPIYNSTKKRSEVTTDFDFVFDGDEHVSIGFGADIRLRICIRGKDELGKDFDPIRYLLYVHLKQHHGIPKVNVVRRERVA